MEIKNYFEVLNKVLNNLDSNSVDLLCDEIIKAYKESRFIFVIGNGGSAANASHFAQDLAKGVFINNQNEQKRIKALSLVDNVPFMTALANDNGYDDVFTGQLKNFSSEGDLLIIISGSGNSKNVVTAVDYAKKNKLKIIGISGYDGGYLKLHSDVSVHVPVSEMCLIESVHSIIFHYVISKIKSSLFNDNLDFEVLKNYN